MRISEFFHLGRSQGDLDFVDIDVSGDTRLFVDPHALRHVPTTWAHECVSLLQDFFEELLKAIRRRDDAAGRRLLDGLHEPNETHLGMSRGRARGHAIGKGFASAIWDSLSRSEAARSGLLVDLEDTALMIVGIDRDLISDITTNVIREPLINYTNDMCLEYGVPLNEGINSGTLWDPHARDWISRFVRLPRAQSGKLLLVPKIIVRQRLEYDADEYYSDYVLEYLRETELAANTELVRTLKDGRRRVTKEDLVQKYGRGKPIAAEFTLAAPGILDSYRRAKSGVASRPLEHEDIAATSGTAIPNWDGLLSEVTNTPTGNDDATRYHLGIERLLTALFYPALSFPKREQSIHEGRKRIDIVFVNTDNRGFFYWASSHYPASHIIVECKNYTGDPANPELDQLSGRFSPSRGQLGLLVCRTFADKQLFIQRCRDTALDQRGYVVPLDDSDLSDLVAARKDGDEARIFILLKERFDKLVM